MQCLQCQKKSSGELLHRPLSQISYTKVDSKPSKCEEDTKKEVKHRNVYHIITLYYYNNEMAKFIINVSKIKGRLEVKISQNIWSNLKKVEIYLISKTMKYKIDPIDLKHLLGKRFTKQNRLDIIYI